MGDSITYGVGDEANGGYRQPLLSQFSRFVSRGNQTLPALPAAYLHHDGYPGLTSANIVADVDGSNADFFNQPDIKPDVVLLHIGTNDYHTLTTDQSRDNIVGIVTAFKARRPYGQIFVMPTINAGSDSTNAALNAFVAALNPKVITALTGVARCHLVGTPTLADGNFLDGSVGIHPNTSGYALMIDDGSGNGWKPALLAAGY